MRSGHCENTVKTSIQEPRDLMGRTKTWTPESGDGNGITETEREYSIWNQISMI